MRALRACFQWIRDVRAEMSNSMENMTSAERSAYIAAREKKALASLPKIAPEQAKKELHALLHPEAKPKSPTPPKRPRKKAAVK